jgi:hypothetical protein
MNEFHVGPHPIETSPFNRTFESLQRASEFDFARWCEGTAGVLKKSWDEDGIPPHGGADLEQVEREMKNLSSRDCANLRIDPATGRKDVIVGAGRDGACCRHIFPNMSKCGDGNAKGMSIYDFLTGNPSAEPEKFKRWHGAMQRIVRRDTLYAFSRSLGAGHGHARGAPRGVEWVLKDADTPYFLEESGRKLDGSELTLSRNDAYILTRLGLTSGDPAGSAEIRAKRAKALLGAKPDEAVFPWLKETHFRLRPFEPDQLIFPKLFDCFRTALVAQGTNFSAAIAKFLYRRYTDPNVVNIVFDPSAGYGGRCLGALAASADRDIHYIATDPNSENWLTKQRSRYDFLAEYYRAAVGQRFYAKTEVYCSGSEDVHRLEAFQRHRGKVDFVFTSPPYFCAEIYSREVTQSAIRFPTYQRWRDGFLKPTLQTCVEWLRPGGVLAWNIADVKIGGHYVPLEQDSIESLSDLGMSLDEKLKMPLAQMPGAAKTVNGVPTTKNHLTLNGND